MASDTSDRTQQAKQEAKGVTDDIRERGQHVADQAKEEAGKVADEVKDKARGQANRQTDRAADALHGVAHQLESMASGSDEEGMLVDYARDGAERLHGLADHLERDGLDGVLHDIESFARRRPGMYIAAGMGVGMVLGRWLKSADMGRMKEAWGDGPSDRRPREVDLTDQGLGRSPVGSGTTTPTTTPTTTSQPGGRV